MALETGNYVPDQELNNSDSQLQKANNLENAIDPIGEWEEIQQLHGAEGLKRLAEFKESLYKNKQKIAKYQVEAIDFIHQNPELTALEQISYCTSLAEEYEFSGKLRELVEEVLLLYEEKHEAVKAYVNKYPKGEDLYESIFKRQPVGQIDIVEGPMTIMLRCQRVEDFAYVDYVLLRGIIPEDEQAFQVDASYKNDSVTGLSLRDFEGIFLLENMSLISNEADSIKLLQHEEQHAITMLFEDTSRAFEIEGRADQILNQLESTRDQKEQSRLLQDYFKIIRLPIDDRVTDEILARIAEGDPMSVNYVELFQKDGLYDFIGRHQRRLDSAVEDVTKVLGADKSALIKEAYDQIFEVQFWDDIAAADSVIKELDYYGVSSGEIIGLFLHAPIGEWPKITDKIVAQKTNHISQRLSTD